MWTIAATVAAAAIALGVVEVMHRVARRLGRRSLLAAGLYEHSHRALQTVAVLVAVRIAVQATTGLGGDPRWRQITLHVIGLAMIAASAWLVASLLLVAQDRALNRFRMDVPNNRQARRIHTQVVILRRLTVAVIFVLTLGVMLMTFPSVRGIGASVLASAGVIGAVAALAAQSVLGNVIAGLQLAFGGAVRLDDVVVVEGEWGRIEEITLSYVVVHIWDDRRLILPTLYFTTKPFQNWTRTQSAVLGAVEFDVDWSVPVQAMREELRRFIEGTGLWDERACALQVTDATGGMVRLRALVSAADAGSLWDLRCLVREHLVEWVRDQRPTALPRMRAEVGEGNGAFGSKGLRRWLGDRASDGGGGDSEDARVFSGSDDGKARGEAFGSREERAKAGTRN
nr:mechanosensitive ion channel domain-containing protein [Planosporangium flavigriseum]